MDSMTTQEEPVTQVPENIQAPERVRAPTLPGGSGRAMLHLCDQGEWYDIKLRRDAYGRANLFISTSEKHWDSYSPFPIKWNSVLVTPTADEAQAIAEFLLKSVEIMRGMNG